MKKNGGRAPVRAQETQESWRKWVLTMLALGVALMVITMLNNENALMRDRLALLEDKISAEEVRKEEIKKNIVITSPAPGTEIIEDKVIVTGKTSPNAELFFYINPAEGEVLGANTFANGGVETANVDGSFSHDLAGVCTQDLTIYAVSIPENEMQKEAWESEDISEPLEITYTGEMSGWCTQ
ncbi:hypothetical protein EBT31_01460 [bacterium]|nr:hypothetical protein [bacterium]NBX50213.1 hypothetical protein [bacterium]